MVISIVFSLCALCAVAVPTAWIRLRSAAARKFSGAAHARFDFVTGVINQHLYAKRIARRLFDPRIDECDFAGKFGMADDREANLDRLIETDQFEQLGIEIK